MPEDEKEAGVEEEESPSEVSIPEENTPENEEKIKARRPPKTDTLVKRDVSFLQKKLAELEIATSEVQETVQKIDLSELEGLKQRVEDIEDLSMVENAGVIELKKMLEDIQTKLAATHELEEKVGNLEQIINAPPELSEVETKIKEGVKTATDELQAVKEEFQSKLDETGTAISDLSKGLSTLSESVPDLEKKIKELDVEKLKEEVKNYAALVPTFPNFEAVTKDLEDSVTSIRHDVESYKSELEKIKQEVEEKVNDSSKIRLSRELGDIRNDLLTNTSKIGNIELFIEDLARQINDVVKEINEINPVIKKFDRFDAEKLKEEVKNYITPLIPEAPDLDKLKRNLEDSIGQLKFDVEAYKKNFERLQQDVEEKLRTPLHGKLLKELEEVKNDSLITNSKFDSIDSFAKELAKEVSAVRPLINRLSSKVESFEGLGDIERSIDEKLHEFRSVLATAETIKESSQPFKEIDHVLSRLRGVEGRLSEIRKFTDEFEKSKEEILTLKWRTDYKKLVDDVNKRFDDLRRDIQSKITGEGNEDMESKLEAVNRNISAIQDLAMSVDKKFENNDKLVKELENDLSVLQGTLMVLESRTSKTPGEDIGQLVDKVSSLESKIANTSQLANRLSNLEINMQESSTDVVDELVNRIVFLESRIAALEGVLSTSKSYPIILE
ncbi:MAG: hypothetical protein HYS80_01740 [Candidatus Aenigmarchaeota archaeon]|nr:hypothetical protein [Candidatus Aenigmarchaeota archaeon]